jgi:hypothetical protein
VRPKPVCISVEATADVILAHYAQVIYEQVYPGALPAYPYNYQVHDYSNDRRQQESTTSTGCDSMIPFANISDASRITHS